MDRKPVGYWKIKQNCVNDAMKYGSITEWIKLSSSASYNTARVNGWLKECCAHMKPIGSRHKRMIYSFEFPDKSVYVGLTYDETMRTADHLNPKRHERSAVFQHIIKTNEYPVLKKLTDYVDVSLAKILEEEFHIMYRNANWNILNRCKTGGIGSTHRKWNFENCFKDAQNYKTRREWENKSISAYTSARKMGWSTECCQHMTYLYKPKNYWSYEMCFEEAKLYQTRRQWQKKSSGSYKFASRNKWVDEMTQHMKPPKLIKK